MSDNKINIAIGSYWHWKHEPELRLVYLGNNLVGQGHWHQFAKADDKTNKVWCEVKDKEIPLMELEQTKPPTVTISRECAESIMIFFKLRLKGWDNIKTIDAYEELTKAMEVSDED